jgi:hypothetical protein
LSEGEFLNSQPENTLRQASLSSGFARSSTKTWTKAPVSEGFSHGFVRSQVARRITTLPMRLASPGLSTMSWVRLLRLFKRPSVAMRCAFGVPVSSPVATLAGGALPTARGTSVASGLASWPSPPLPQAASKPSAASRGNTERTTAAIQPALKAEHVSRSAARRLSSLVLNAQASGAQAS